MIEAAITAALYASAILGGIAAVSNPEAAAIWTVVFAVLLSIMVII